VLGGTPRRPALCACVRRGEGAVGREGALGSCERCLRTGRRHWGFERPAGKELAAAALGLWPAAARLGEGSSVRRGLGPGPLNRRRG
jgi:hypothetical protein